MEKLPGLPRRRDLGELSGNFCIDEMKPLWHKPYLPLRENAVGAAKDAFTHSWVESSRPGAALGNDLRLRQRSVAGQPGHA